MNILITGGTGLIGKELGKRLVIEGHKIYLLSRSEPEKVRASVPYPCEVITGDISSGPVALPDLGKIEAVYHLAGESVMGRWNEDKKDAIWSSRVEGTKNLLESLVGAKKLKVFVSASATGYYGNRGEEELTEESAVGEGFLAAVTKNWEEALVQAGESEDFKKVRFVAIRTPMVLSRTGGALQMLVPVFDSYLGAPLGTGEQWMSWIHLYDLCSVYVRALTDEKLVGPVNAVSPHPVRNREFTKRMAQGLGKKSLPMKVPDVALEVLFGEMKEVILDSQKVLPKKLDELDHEFDYPELEMALENLLTARREGDQELWQEQYVSAPLEQVFSFFSSETNLEKITPSFMNFNVLGKSTKDIGEGTEINYKLKVHGVPLKWTSVIEMWQPGKAFVDRQVKGPYKKWVHTHSFEELGDGVLITDYVRYKLPVGMLGRIAGGAFVGRDLKKIFDYRRSYIAREFGGNGRAE